MSFTACASAVKAAITQRIEAILRPRLRKPSEYFNSRLATTKGDRQAEPGEGNPVQGQHVTASPRGCAGVPLALRVPDLISRMPAIITPRPTALYRPMLSPSQATLTAVIRTMPMPSQRA